MLLCPQGRGGPPQLETLHFQVRGQQRTVPQGGPRGPATEAPLTPLNQLLAGATASFPLFLGPTGYTNLRLFSCPPSACPQELLTSGLSLKLWAHCDLLRLLLITLWF